VRGFPLSMEFAEKIVTAAQRGTVNTRWRDYADIALLSAAHDVNGDELAASIDVVATHRNATLMSPGLLSEPERSRCSVLRIRRLGVRIPPDALW
jgi:hypothetical protein